ncbi:DNA polymerase III subunit alpha [Halobacillus sp. Marseille-Q1614]|uniref:DNA polymerase III subunit alpha n=1 Tax=Halobacillus sp. Marseille-Q1614 TaxID=2709134 RepID=UPI00156D9598|nr:DNA polymerase III subunit alpha [Halobacillus sp. Marseille-Q1614]
MSLTHLQVHSGYSLMKSTIQIPSLVQQAEKLGFSALALTDHEVMSGAVLFYKACRNAGIKPLIGMTADLNFKSESFPVVLLAKNNQGYQSLLCLSTMIQTREEALSLEDVKGKAAGLIVVVTIGDTSWGASIINHNFDRVEEEFGEWSSHFEHLYMGVKDYGLHTERPMHKSLKLWCEEREIPAVYLNDVRYLEKGDAEAYHCLRSMDEGRVFQNNHNLDNHQYLKSQKEMKEYFQEVWPEVLQTNEELTDLCDISIPLDTQLLPAYPLPDGVHADKYLKNLCETQLCIKYGASRPEAKERLAHELQVISNMGFSDYFLIVWDFVEHARKQGIEAGPGRGSAAGSIVSYLLGITQVDPLAYGLLFERFLNPERISMPDIDIDFPDDRRDEVIEYVAGKYGKNHVAQICTFGTFATRSVLREVFKALDVETDDVNFILNHIPSSGSRSLKKAVQESEMLKDYIRSSEKLKKAFHIAHKLEGLPRHVSTHAAGVVISEKPLTNYTPLMEGQENIHLTQLAMGDIEAVGLLKMDFLGLRNLTLLRKLKEKINNYKDSGFNFEALSLDDAPTLQLLRQGQTNGIFQLESQGMKNVLKRLKPTHFEDIVAVNALYRPGPMEYIPVYINRKHGREQVQYPHPDLEPILSKTYGVLIYQEQIMQVAQKIGGYSLGEADLLRRAVSKKQQNVFEKQRNRFIEGAESKGYDREVAVEVFDWIVRFSNYGFNRSHAVAYSVISYYLAFAKAHYPALFIAELINSTLGDHEKLAAYIREAREFSVKVKSPSINQSYAYAIDEQGAIRIGLLSIKGVGFQAVKEIVEERKKGRYKHLNDFCLRLPSQHITRSVIEALVMAGAFDELQQNRASLLASVDQALEQGELFKEFQDQPGLFDNDLSMDEPAERMEPFPVLKKLAMEKDVLGTYLSEHPLENHRRLLMDKGYVDLRRSKEASKGKAVKTAAVVEKIKEIRTKRGDPMAFLTISDETEEMEAVLFPDAHREARKWLGEKMLVLIEGKVESRNGKVQWIINSITPYEELNKEPRVRKRLFIKVSLKEEQNSIDRLRKISSYFPGNIPVIIFISEDRKTYQLESSYSLSASEKCLNKLHEFFGESSVVLQAYHEKDADFKKS